MTLGDLKLLTPLFPVDNLMHMDDYGVEAIMFYFYCFNFLPDYDNLEEPAKLKQKIQCFGLMMRRKDGRGANIAAVDSS